MGPCARNLHGCDRLFHLLQTWIVTSVGKSNVTGVLYFTKPCQVPVPTKSKPRSLQVRESAKVHREGGVPLSFWALVLENASSTGKCSGGANQPCAGAYGSMAIAHL